jgi:hypothetical protein
MSIPSEGDDLTHTPLLDRKLRHGATRGHMALVSALRPRSSVLPNWGAGSVQEGVNVEDEESSHEAVLNRHLRHKRHAVAGI